LPIPNPGIIKAEYVISKGKVIAREGNLLVSPRKHVFSKDSLNSIHLLRELEPSDFSIVVKKNSSHINARIIDQVTDLVTKELILSVPVINGEIRSDVRKDILKVAAVDRRYSPGKIFVGLIRGFHLSTGAIACSAAWDTSDIIVVMTDMPIEMLAKRMEEITKITKDLGFPFDDPLLTLVTLTGAAIPFLRICEEGLVNLKNGKTLGLIVD
jgi:adenine deaminase